MSLRRAAKIVAPALAASLLLATRVLAQGVDEHSALNHSDPVSSNFNRDRNVTVRERQQPGYQALGIRRGDLLIEPKLSTTLSYRDNVFATAAGEASDSVLTITPELNISANWFHQYLRAYARANIRKFGEYRSENAVDIILGAISQIELDRRTKLNITASFNSSTEARTAAASTTDLVKPIHYQAKEAQLNGTREFNRVRATGQLEVRELAYENGRTRQGALAIETDRDRTITAATGRLDYAISPNSALFLEVVGNERRYRFSSASTPGTTNGATRNSSGLEVLMGTNVDLTHLIRGEVGLGYLRQTFADPRFHTIDGLGARAQVAWFPTQLMTVTLTGTRTLEDSSLGGSAGYVSSYVGAQVDYELLRNLVLSASGALREDRYRGVKRIDDGIAAGVGGTYLLNRDIGVTLSYSIDSRNSRGANAGPDFDAGEFGASLHLQY